MAGGMRFNVGLIALGIILVFMGIGFLGLVSANSSQTASQTPTSLLTGDFGFVFIFIGAVSFLCGVFLAFRFVPGAGDRGS